MPNPPIIPESAPFAPDQRLWLNGYLAALFSSMSSASPGEDLGPRPRVVVMWGSQSGNAEGLAQGFGQRLSASGFDAPVLSMEDYAKVNLAEEKQILVICSTWGDGDPPDNAAEFWSSLSAEDHPRLEHLGFAALGLGDSNYLNFCAMGKKLDSRFEQLGARRMVPRMDCDVDFEGIAEEWFQGVLDNLDGATNGSNGTSIGETAPVAETSPSWSKSNPYPARLKANVPLNAPSSPRDTRHFEIDLGESGLTYDVGDVLGTFPQNCPQLVEEIVTALKCTGDESVLSPSGAEVSLRQALQSDYAITSINRKFLATFAEFTSSESLTRLLDPANKTELAEYLWGREIIDLLAANPGHSLSASDFVGMLGKLSPRLYSIASSIKAHPGEVHLTVARVSYESHGRSRKGVASTWLSDRVGENGTVPMFLQEAKHFKLPADGATPIIMVGPGTGIAPFRAFLEDRQASGASGQNWLFFGNPHRETDYLYEDQLTSMFKGGTLHRLDTAWSRDQAEKIYVQHLMRQQAADLWSWIDQGAHFYVCGDAKYMAKDVDSALHDLIAVQGGLGPDKAAEYVSAMKKEKRYQRDVY